MTYRDTIRSPTATPAPILPSTCPVCRSSSISTSAKNPDAGSYWRCEACGEIWNVSRREAASRGANRWR